MKSEAINALLFSILTWSLLILLFGYQFGNNDHIELLPYILKLNNPSLYPNDFFISSMMEMIPNERHLFSLILSFIPSAYLKVTFFILHFLSTLVLVLGLHRFAAKFISNRYLIWMTIFFNLLVFLDWNFGNVEMYYSMFQASSIAKAIAIWSVIFFIEDKRTISFILLSVVTYIQIIVGIDLAVVFGVVILLEYLKHRKLSALKPLLLYSVVTLPFLLAIVLARQGPGFDTYFDIMFRFRHPHHFYMHSPARFCLMLSLFLVSVKFYMERSTAMLTAILTISVGLIIYYLSVEFLESVFLTNFQWYKNSIWLKFFGFVALFGIADKHLRAFKLKWFLESTFLVSSIAIVMIFATELRYKTNYDAPCDFPFLISNLNNKIEICRQIKDKTDVDALFIQPFDFTELKYYAERGSYIDFKAVPRTPKYAGDWYNRVVEIYGVETKHGSGFGLKSKANLAFASISNNRLDRLKSYGITHILTEPDHILSAPVIAHNSDYIVYKISD